MKTKLKGLLAAMTLTLLSGCLVVVNDDIAGLDETQFRVINLVAPQIDLQNTDSKDFWTEDLVQNLNYGAISESVKFNLGSDNQRDYLLKAIDSNTRQEIVNTHRITLQQTISYLLYQYGNPYDTGLARPLMRTSQVFTSPVGSGLVRTRFIHTLPYYIQNVDIYIDNYKKISNLSYGNVSMNVIMPTSTGSTELRVVKSNLNPNDPANQLLTKTLFLNDNSSYQIFIAPANANGNYADATLYREPTE